MNLFADSHLFSSSWLFSEMRYKICKILQHSEGEATEIWKNPFTININYDLLIYWTPDF